MKRRTFLYSFSASLILPFFRGQDSLQHQVLQDTSLLIDPNSIICAQKFKLASLLKLNEKPINEVIIGMAKTFLGSDYAANTIESPGKEQLVFDLKEVDCVTFYENSLVLALCIKKDRMTFEDFKKELQFVRYRDGIMKEYPSRLHYTSDYFFDNEKKGILKDITKEIGGVKNDKKIDFMSAHPETYARLKENPEFVGEIREIENEINKRNKYYVPKKKLGKIAGRIENGDIIGITTDIEGLDCSHTGIAIWKGKKLHMIHAPSPGKKVQITASSLEDYLMQIKKDTGIMAARPLEPAKI